MKANAYFTKSDAKLGKEVEKSSPAASSRILPVSPSALTNAYDDPSSFQFFYCLACRLSHHIANPCSYITCCPRHRTIFVSEKAVIRDNLQSYFSHLLPCHTYCAACTAETSGFSSVWITHLQLEAQSLQSETPSSLHCPVCFVSSISRNEFCQKHLTRCPAHHQLFVERHVDNLYYRHLTAEDYYCLDCFAPGVEDKQAREAYRRLRSQYEELIWGTSRTQLPLRSTAYNSKHSLIAAIFDLIESLL